MDHPLQIARLFAVCGFLSIGVLQLLLTRFRRDPLNVRVAIWSADAAVFVFARYLVSSTTDPQTALFGFRLERAAGLLMVPLAIYLAAAVAGRPVRAKRTLIVISILAVLAPFAGYLIVTPTLTPSTDPLGLRYYIADDKALHLSVALVMLGLLLIAVGRMALARSRGPNRDHRTVFRLSLLLLLPASVNDLLMQNGWIDSIPLLDLALGVQILTLVWLLGRRLSALQAELEKTISERTSELAKTLRGLRALLDMLPDTVLVYRRNRIRYINRSGAEMLRCDRDKLVGESLDQMVDLASRAEVIGLLRRAGRGEPTAFNAELVRWDGTHLTADVTASACTYDGEPASVAVIRDITARKTLERKLRVADRLASIGRLASGVGHEINNPLAAVIANLYEADELVSELEGPANDLDELRRSLSEARHGADRVRGIVADLRMLSRGDVGKGSMTEVDLVHVVAQTAQLARYETRHAAELHIEMSEVEPVLGNPSRLGQLVLNLLINAAEAMDGSRPGRIDVRVRSGASSDTVILEIQDNGRGMSPETLARAADPFYTTKDVNEGTGLGLALCYGVAEAHGGVLEIDSKLGVGTTARLTLPAASSRLQTGRIARLAPAQKPAPAPAVEIAEQRRTRVLVVDDEERLARAFARLLREYDASVATSGAAALEAWDAEPFDVIICDLMMPEMNGAQLYAELCARDPTVQHRFILITGGACTAETEQFLADSKLELLRKPVSPPQLREVVARYVERLRAGSAGAA